MQPRPIPLMSITALAASALLSACAFTPRNPQPLSLTNQTYPIAFQAAIEELRRLDFTIERIDARAGIITTAPKPTAGWATPWTREQSTIAQETLDLLHEHRRVVRITFEPASASSAPTSPGAQTAPLSLPTDLRNSAEPLIAHVRVITNRIQRPGRKLDPTSIRFTTTWQDPKLVQRRMQPLYAVPIERDTKLEQRIAYAITKATTNAARP